MNQYQACLYLFECIFLGDSKYGQQNQKCWHFLIFCDLLCLSSVYACRVLSVNELQSRGVSIREDGENLSLQNLECIEFIETFKNKLNIVYTYINLDRLYYTR